MKKITDMMKKYPIATFAAGMLFAGTAYGIKAMSTVTDLKNKVVGGNV